MTKLSPSIRRPRRASKKHPFPDAVFGLNSVKTAIKLADALGVTLDELCRDTPDKTE